MSWVWAAASSRGTSHQRDGSPLQDVHSCFLTDAAGEEKFVAIVSDGAGSTSHGGHGAALVCRTLGVAARQHYLAHTHMPTELEVQLWLDAARDKIYHAAEQRQKHPSDFACTLVCAISTGHETMILHVGDGCAVIREKTRQEWVAPTWPEQGEYASTTSFVTESPTEKLRISNYAGEIDAVFVFSDGLERLVLDFAARAPFPGFFENIARPVSQSTAAGRDSTLSEHLKIYLNSEPVNLRTDDDKTLIAAVRR